MKGGQNMKNHIYVVLLLVLATLTANAQNGAKGKFLTTYQKNGQEEAVSSGGIVFVKDNTSERYAWQPSAWQQSDYPTLGEAFDIKHVKSIFRYVESDNQFTVTLPEEAPVTEEDVIVEAYGQEITPTEDNVYTTGASSVSVVNEDGKTIYDCYVSLDDQDTQRSIEINALETAYTLLLPIFPHIYETTSDEILTILKSLLAELPETHALAEAIDRSIVKNGYFDIDDVETEYQAAIDCIVEKTGLRNNYLKPGSDNPRRRVTPQQPAVINGNGVYGYKLVMNSSKWVHNDLGKAWNCNLTAYNSNRFAYTAWVRGWKGSDGLIYSKYFNNSDICQNLNNYDILRKSLLKPQRVSTFMGTFTNPVTDPFKRESWDGICDFYKDTWNLFTGEGPWLNRFEDMTWDCTKKTFDMSFTTSNDVVIVLGPADNDLMMYYNVLKTVIDPIIKKVAKKLTNAEDEDYMLNFCIDLLADENYRSEFYSIFNSNKMFSTKAKEILVLTWPKMETYLNKILCEYIKTKGEQFVWDHFGWVSAMALEESLQKVKDNWNKYLKIVEKVGDVSLGVLGLFEGSYYYDLALDFDDTDYRFKIHSYEVNGIRYSLYKRANKSEGQPNADGWVFYNSVLSLDVTKNGNTITYNVGDGLYLDEGANNGQTQCMAIDLNSRMIYIFSNSKTRSRNYSMDGYTYVSSLDDINFHRETVFSNANWGWFPYFTYSNGTLQVQHFSYNGYYAMTSTRNASGSWSTVKVGSIQPAAFENRWEENGSLLIVGGGS